MTIESAKVSTKPDRIVHLYREHAGSGMRLCLLLERDPEAAEDLLQDAFVRVFGRLDSLRDEVAFPAYLRKTIINLHTSRLRRRRVERAFTRKEASLARQEHSDLPGVEREDEVLTVLRTLPGRQRMAIFLRFYEDLSERDLAAALGCSTGAAKALLHRAMSALRERLEAEDG